MRRYDFLTKHEIYSALNKVRDALLAAKDGNQVNEILEGLFTDEEKIKLGRRLLIAEQLRMGVTHDEIADELRVGKTTINSVYKKLVSNPECFRLIFKRGEKVEKEYQSKKYRKVGGSTLVFKKKIYTGITRKDIKR